VNQNLKHVKYQQYKTRDDLMLQ